MFFIGYSWEGNLVQLLELNHITKTYKNGQVKLDVLKDINIRVNDGEFLSIMGPSGSGKSTLLNIIGCLDLPTTGTYMLAGQQIEKLKDSRLADIRNEYLSFVFQSFHLLPELDAIANVELPLIYRGMGSKERKKKALTALASVGLSERIHHKPTQLSGGEQQRVAIARALAGEPKIILADEPTGALDSRSSNTIMAIFQRLNREQGLTIIQVTHDYKIACHSHRIIHLLDGMIEREGTPDCPIDALEQEKLFIGEKELKEVIG